LSGAKVVENEPSTAAAPGLFARAKGKLGVQSEKTRCYVCKFEKNKGIRKEENKKNFNSKYVFEFFIYTLFLSSS